MGSVTAYETAAGKRYRVRYRKPDHGQTDKRGFKTKKAAVSRAMKNGPLAATKNARWWP